jgi:diguanylate cyclase (GGDEF)-like protein
MSALLAILSTIALLGISAWTATLARRARQLKRQVEEAETRHRAFITQAEHGGALRRKIEAQLLEKQQHLDKLAHHDQLTGLPNRLFLTAWLPQAMEESRRKSLPLAVLFLDLDRFKHINDTHGHETGDKLLQTVALRVRDAVRSDDVVVRMGGDEFVVILTNVKSNDQVNETAGRITTSLAMPIVIDGKPLATTVSIGVSLYPRDGEDVGALLRHSDTAMYQAKDRGRNNFQVFSPQMDRRLKERVSIETSLRAALRASELDVYYQPLIDLDTRRVAALEALVRWKNHDGVFIPPMQFIPIAEESGLIVAVGEFVLRRVVADMVQWRSQGTKLVPVALNVSAGQLRRSDLGKLIGELIASNDIDPRLLQIELTEGALFEQLEGRQGESNEDAVTNLREMGLRVSIDDFGTGYSSLSYLKRWHVDYLKIDRSFVRDLVTDTNDHAIVGAIIAMAQHLKIKVIAEGVEGWAQLDTLRRLGCRYAQGFLFAEPAPAKDCGLMLRGGALGLDVEDTDMLVANL